MFVDCGEIEFRITAPAERRENVGKIGRHIGFREARPEFAPGRLLVSIPDDEAAELLRLLAGKE